MSTQETKQRILDVAERLFASDGYHGTSLRAITGGAHVNLAAVNYHFGSKEALITAVIERRLVPINRLRTKRLAEVRQTAARSGRRPVIKDVLFAFIEPTLLFKESGPGARDFIALVGRAIAEPDDTVRKIFMGFMDLVFHLLFETLAEAAPHIPRDVLFWRISFAIGAISHTMLSFGRCVFIPAGVEPEPDARALVEMLVPFVAAGMEASL